MGFFKNWSSAHCFTLEIDVQQYQAQSDTHNNAVYEEVDAGVDEEEEVGDGLGVEEVGGGEVVVVVAQAFHWVVHGHHGNHCLRQCVILSQGKVHRKKKQTDVSFALTRPTYVQ